MAFYLPIEQPLDPLQLDALIRRYDPLSADTPALDFRRVRGMLKGFIDLVFRHDGRYYLLDYKSNWLGEDREAYTQQAMIRAMRLHRYDLQYQLYSPGAAPLSASPYCRLSLRAALWRRYLSLFTRHGRAGKAGRGSSPPARRSR